MLSPNLIGDAVLVGIPSAASIIVALVGLLLKKGQEAIGKQVSEVHVLVNGAKTKLELELAVAKDTIAHLTAQLSALLPHGDATGSP